MAAIEAPELVEVFWPVELTGDTNTIVADGGSTDLDPGRYYTTGGLESVDEEHQLLDAVEEASGVSWGFSVGERRNLAFSGDDLNLDHPDWTLPPEYVGWRQSDDTISPLEVAPWMQAGRWFVLNRPSEDWHARHGIYLQEWRGWVDQTIAQSSPGEGGIATPWERNISMRLEAINVPSVQVYGGRSGSLSEVRDLWASETVGWLDEPVDETQVGNHHYALEHLFVDGSLWQTFRQADSLVVVLRYADADDIEMRARIAEHTDNFGEWIEDMGAGERYRVSIPLEVGQVHRVEDD